MRASPPPPPQVPARRRGHSLPRTTDTVAHTVPQAAAVPPPAAPRRPCAGSGARTTKRRAYPSRSPAPGARPPPVPARLPPAAPGRAGTALSHLHETPRRAPRRTGPERTASVAPGREGPALARISPASSARDLALLSPGRRRTPRNEMSDRRKSPTAVRVPRRRWPAAAGTSPGASPCCAWPQSPPRTGLATPSHQARRSGPHCRPATTPPAGSPPPRRLTPAQP